MHHALQMPEHSSRIDAALYLRQLCRAICGSKLDAKGIKLLLVERPFQMDSERCWRLGLIVSELITNSTRHAFRDNGGLIRVELLPSSVDHRMSCDGQRHKRADHPSGKRNEDYFVARPRASAERSTSILDRKEPRQF